MSTFHQLTISEVKQETPNSVSISFTIPNALKDNFVFQAGQYITIRHHFEGKEIRRAYSICSHPKEEELRVGIKRVKGGVFSEYANSEIRIGDRLDVMPPEGKFVLEPASHASKNYAAFVAGSGITPVFSIIQTALTEEPNSTFSLVYGNQTAKETMFLEDLQHLQKTYPNRLNVQYIFSREESKNALFGRIDQARVNFLLKNNFHNTNFQDFYLCGPETMINTVSSVLQSHNIHSEQIHHELFTTSEDAGDVLVQTHDGDSSITIIVDDETETFTMPQSKSILEAALANDIDAPYSCQGGICSSCIARVTDGKAEMRKNQILTDGEINEGLILTCQAYPSSAALTVDFDDV